MNTTVDTKFFRAGVGTVIYNQERKVLWFKRAYFPVGVWQFQQGGINCGEDMESTLWRELYEEVGLTKNSFTHCAEYPHWTVHAYSEEFLNAKPAEHRNRLGQIHRWFFLQIKEDVQIDLAQATDQEFSDYEWTDFDTAIQKTDPSKQPVYSELKEFFATLAT
jgi:putative (di)nucleoside polyphosphate hydrolase